MGVTVHMMTRSMRWWYAMGYSGSVKGTCRMVVPPSSSKGVDGLR
jgi:hypothetical protein